MKNLLTIALFGLLAIVFTACGGEEKVAEAVPAPPKAITVDKSKINNIQNTKNVKNANSKMNQMGTVGTAKMPWVELGNVESLVKKEKKKVLVDVYTPWCGPCKMMDRMTFTDQALVDAVSKSFYPVKYNADGPDSFKFMGKEYGNPNFDPKKTRGRNARHELANFFSVRGYPTMVVMDENMKIVDKIVGYKKPNELLAALEKHM